MADESGNTQRNRPEDRLPKNTRWPKGVSGNPSGRPKKRPITDALLDILSPEEIAKYWAQRIRKRDMHAIKEAIEREEGKVPQAIQIEDGLVVKIERNVMQSDEDSDSETP